MIGSGTRSTVGRGLVRSGRTAVPLLAQVPTPCEQLPRRARSAKREAARTGALGRGGPMSAAATHQWSAFTVNRLQVAPTPARSLQCDDAAALRDSVEDGLGQDAVVQRGAPVFERLVGGQQRRERICGLAPRMQASLSSGRRRLRSPIRRRTLALIPPARPRAGLPSRRQGTRRIVRLRAPPGAGTDPESGPRSAVGEHAARRPQCVYCWGRGPSSSICLSQICPSRV